VYVRVAVDCGRPPIGYRTLEVTSGRAYIGQLCAIAKGSVTHDMPCMRRVGARPP